MDGIIQPKSKTTQSAALLPRYVRHALDYMRGNLGEKITLAGLASACSIPERTLLKQFERFLGQSPLALLRRLRLNAARNALLKPDSLDSIADIATSCGFSHLGRFAADYRRLFGETPSTTRQRIGMRASGNPKTHRGVLRPVPALARKAPDLSILPLSTETLEEGIEARALAERLAAALAGMRVASVSLVSPCRTHSLGDTFPRNIGTRYCLLGRLTRRGERLRVIVRLVDAAVDRHLWGDSFDGSSNDPFELQDRTVDGVLCGVVAHITDAEIARVNHQDPKDLAARHLALRALPLILNANLPSTERAMDLLNRAIDMDPADATATAYLAYCHAQRANYIATASLAADRAAALNLSQRAGALDNSDPRVLTARGAVAAWALNSDYADALVTGALAIDPTSTWAWMLRGHTRRGSADAAERAIADYQRSIRLRGPGISTSSCIYSIGAAHWNAGRYHEAVRWIRQAMPVNPDAMWMHRHLSCAAAKLGDMATVADSVDRMRRAQPHLSVSLLVENYPVADPDWLHAIARAGMPLS
jgi:AraC-like DNA-binding protein/TolB-like protein